MKNKWPDFLFSVAVRFFFGCLLGILLSLAFGLLGRPHHMSGRKSRSFILDHLDSGDYQSVILWILVWGVSCGILCTFSIPRWQTPWYKGVLNDEKKKGDDDHVA